ncbi:MAG TPA: metal ABC transporter permease [Actinomycetota bacterium]|nr:metal ABC transporter permease [Actinomycetota bacterium]
MDLLGWWSDYTLRTVALGTATIGATAGVLGSFAVLRRQSLLGDTISHAALPGIALAFLLTGTKALPVLIAGAAVAGWLGARAAGGLTSVTRLKSDAALGVVLSVFFGFGLMLLTFIQRRPDATQAGLDTFLFGQAAALLQRDVVAMAAVGAAAVSLVALFWKEIKVQTFDPGFAASIGLPVARLDLLVTTLLVAAIVIGLESVGVVLMSALVVAPAAAARQWTDHLSGMVVLAAAFGAVSGASGALISASARHLPTGPVVVLCASLIVVVSLLAAPARGVVIRRARDRRARRRFGTRAVLSDLYALARQHDDPEHAHAAAVLEAMSGGRSGVRGDLEELERRGMARRAGDDGWFITDAGRARAERELEETS